MTYVAPILGASIVGLWLLRYYLRKLETKINFPIWLHYFTWLYLLCLWVLYRICCGSYQHVIAATDWLDPDTTKNFVENNIKTESQPMGDLEKWEAEASLAEYPWLRVFSLISPVWIVATFSVCCWHTCTHVNVVAKAKRMKLVKGLVDMKLHDETILILAIPLFYGLMSLASVHRMWEVCVDHSGTETYLKKALYSDFSERKDFLDQMYDANYVVGDVYETYALINFGKLLMEVIDRVHRAEERNHNDVLTKERDHDDVVTDLFETAVGAGLLQQRRKQKMDRASTFHQQRIIHHKEALKSMTLSGIRLFNYVCVAHAFYILTVTEMRYHGIMPKLFGTNPNHPGFFQSPKVRNGSYFFFSGSGCIASIAAIGNISEVEQIFHKELTSFQPFAKFWATKILITIAFVQSVLLQVVPPFSTWTQTRNQLLYSSFLCCECFFLAVLHTKTWPHDEEWFEDNELYEDGCSSSASSVTSSVDIELVRMSTVTSIASDLHPALRDGG